MTIIMLFTMIPTLMSYYFASGQISGSVLKVSMIMSFSILHYVSIKSAGLESRRIFVIIFVIMGLLSLFSLTPDMPYLTLICISLLMISGVLSRNIEFDTIAESFSQIAIICSVLLVWKLLTMNLDMATILRRGYVWTEIFAWAGLSSIWPICLFSAFLMKKRKLMYPAIIISLLCVIVNSISLKRYIYVDVAIAIALMAYVSKKQKTSRFLKYLLVIAVPLISILFYFVSSGVGENVIAVTNAISDRFSESADEVSSFDRLEETQFWLSKEAGFLDVVLGTGFLSAHHGIPDEEMNYLHIGWFNLIFKGGLLLFFAVLM